jgi:hypothetical protein
MFSKGFAKATFSMGLSSLSPSGAQEIRRGGVLQAVVKSGKAQWLTEILMQCTCRSMVLGLLLAAPVLFAQTVPDQTAAPDAATPTPHQNSHKAPAPAPVVLPPMPSGPLSQLPMDQIPPTPAKVTFQGGLLTISAQNATLGEILRDVRKLTGASIEFPQGSNGSNERVVTHLGPGAPRDVLAVLLNGSSFNYMMVGSNSDPTAVSSVILMAKPSAAGEPQPQTAANVYQNSPQAMAPTRFPGPQPFNRQLVPQPGQPAIAQPAGAEEDLKDDDDAADDTTADDQAQPGQPAQPDANAQPQPADPNQPNAGPKTPEQILDQLRRQQQPNGVAPPPQPPQQPPQQ